ncbi:hypothetical protein [Ralstonia syzygii]|uniref:hypothetical protein n=1 Tax=Ralstonia syzygii TaxID=28097 RepID=UPI0023DC85F0|nr:hypothetical protein [Ralstonia syzygii]
MKIVETRRQARSQAVSPRPVAGMIFDKPHKTQIDIRSRRSRLRHQAGAFAAIDFPSHGGLV